MLLSPPLPRRRSSNISKLTLAAPAAMIYFLVIFKVLSSQEIVKDFGSTTCYQVSLGDLITMLLDQNIRLLEGA